MTAAAATRPLAGVQAVGDVTDDYTQAATVRYLNDPELDQFAVVSDLLQSLAQAHVLDHIDKGAYKTIVATSLAAPGGVQGAVAEEWTVEAKTIDSTTEPGYVRVRVWTNAELATSRIRAEFRFFAPPRLHDDGTLADYGTWHLDLGYGSNHEASLALDVASSEDGTSVAKLHRITGSAAGGETRAIFQRTQDVGHGHSIESAMGSAREVAYAYDKAQLAVQAGSSPVVVKLRTDAVDVAYRYGLYDAASKQDVRRTKNFGFPLRIVGAGSSAYGFYSSWRGRSYVLDSTVAAIPASTRVQQLALTGEAGATYTVAPTRLGVMSRSSFVESSPGELRDFVAQLWLDSLQTVRFDGSGFQVCQGAAAWLPPHPCTAWQSLNDLSVLADGPAIHTFASLVGSTDQVFRTYKYRTGGAAGFYELLADGTVSSQRYVPLTGDYFAVHTVGFRYVTLTSAGWIEKTVAASSPSGVEFVPGGDHAFSLEPGKVYSLYAHGNQFTVTLQPDGSYRVMLRVDTVLTPGNVARLAPTTAVFSPAPATGSDGSTYRFISDAADAKFLQLVYVDVGAGDAAFGARAGDVVTKSLSGLTGHDGAASIGSFDWDRSPYTGVSTSLLDASGAAVTIEEPIPFGVIELANHAGRKQSFSLSFDGTFGQLAGVPDVRTAMFENGNVMTRDLADSYVGLPSGSILVDARDGHSYLTKPLVLVQFLPTAGSDPGNLDVAGARQLDLATVPSFVDRAMGDAPSVAP